MAKELEDYRAAARRAGVNLEAAADSCRASLAKLDETIEASDLFITKCENLALGGSDNSVWGRAIQFEGLPVEEVIKRANEDDPLARSYLCVQAGLALSSEKPLPRALQLYAAMVLLESSATLAVADARQNGEEMPLSCCLLDMLKTFDVPPTRSEGTDTDEQRCGSRIVAEWLNEVGVPIGEPGVAKVCGKIPRANLGP